MGNTDSRPSSNPNFLTKPVTDKHGLAGSGLAFNFGMASMQGWRAHMEGPCRWRMQFTATEQRRLTHRRGTLSQTPM